MAQKHPNASDEGGGSPEKPFLTIKKAADNADGGDMVLIHEGEYHETVRPTGSGRSETEMLCFMGKKGDRVVVTGAETLKGPYQKSEGWKPSHSNNKKNVFSDPQAKVYMARFPRGIFIDSNPFAMINGPLIPWYGSDIASMFMADSPAQKKTAVMRRGMVFCDGKRLAQVSNYFEMGDKPGVFFVEDDGLTLHLRLPEDDDPVNHVVEFTAREQCFCPEKKYCSYVKIENIRFIKSGNGFPPPQRGAVSVNCGSHFIISNCVVEDVNGVGIDIGFQCPAMYSSAPRGRHIVSGCVISRCGICGLAGVPGSSDIHYIDMQQPSVIVADNKLYDNCWQDFEGLMESASIKLHHLRDSVINKNYINKTTFGCGIWADASCENVKISENAVVRARSNYGGIFFEASHEHLELSHNVIVNSICHEEKGGNGIYSHNCDNILNVKNIILGCARYGILHKYGGTGRINMGRGNTGFGVDFFENIISHCQYALMQPTDKGKAGKNIYGEFSGEGYLKVGMPELHLDLEAWRKYMGWDKDGFMADIEYSLVPDGTALDLSITAKGKRIDAQLLLHMPLKTQIEELFKNIKACLREGEIA